MVGLVPAGPLGQGGVQLLEHAISPVGEGAVDKGLHYPADTGILRQNLFRVIGLRDLGNVLHLAPKI